MRFTSPRPRLVRFLDSPYAYHHASGRRLYEFGVYLGKRLILKTLHVGTIYPLWPDGITFEDSWPPVPTDDWVECAKYMKWCEYDISNYAMAMADGATIWADDPEGLLAAIDTPLVPLRDREFVQNLARHLQGANLPTFVYLMTDTATGFTKIGRSKRPKVRESTLFSEKPSIELIEAWKAETAEERHLHNRFYERRVRGEWFALTDEDIAWIRNYFKGRMTYAESKKH